MIEEILKLVGNRAGAIKVSKESVYAERAEHNIQRMEEAKERLNELIRKKCRLDVFTMNSDIESKALIVGGDKIADIQAESRHKKTPYKKIVEGIEGHLQGLAFNANRGRHTTDVVKRDGAPYLHVGRALEDFDTIVAGNLGITIEYNVTPAIEYTELNGQLVIPNGADKELSANTIRLLMQINYALPKETAYLKKFKKEASKGSPKKGVSVTPVSKGKVVEGGKTEKTVIDYMDVVRTLIPVPTENHTRDWDPELPYLVSEASFSKKKRIVPWYDLEQGRNGERLGTYVGIKSLYDRVQELKHGTTRKISIPFADVKSAF
ncbi:hypothetical protein ACFLZ7_00065 [Nanoarchaeota archaeon]